MKLKKFKIFPELSLYLLVSQSINVTINVSDLETLMSKIAANLYSITQPEPIFLLKLQNCTNRQFSKII